jgi:short subunit dehydrogenase-like uncharacterized protein
MKQKAGRAELTGMTGNMIKSRLLLYGAYGYTGRLAAELAVAKNLDIVLAGRHEGALSALGDRLNLPTRVVGLDDMQRLSAALKDITCVVHAAGPFAITSAPMLNACLATKTNYIDITGEIEVFEALWSRREEIRSAGITVVPGAGFDVVPSDCLAGFVSSKLRRPCSLVMAVRGLETASPVLCRRAGAIVPLDDRSTRWVDFGSGEEPCVPVSWGDVATAFHSTGIGDITALFPPNEAFAFRKYCGKAVRPTASQQSGTEGTRGNRSPVSGGAQPSSKKGTRVYDLGESGGSGGQIFFGNFMYPGCL